MVNGDKKEQHLYSSNNVQGTLYNPENAVLQRGNTNASRRDSE